MILWDTFTGSNGTNLTSLSHTMEVGGGWTAQSGTWTINASNQAICSADNGTDHQNACSADAISANHAIVCDMTLTTTVDAGFVIRLTDSTHYLLLAISGATNTMYLYQRSGATFTELTNVGFSFNPGSTYKVVFSANGNNIFGFMYGATTDARNNCPTVSLSYTTSFNNTATKCGLRAYLASPFTTPAFDNFCVYSPTELFAYDFENSSGPHTAAGFTSITETTTYSAGVNPGWAAGSINALDRGIGSALFRDIAYSADMTFKCDIPNAAYEVVPFIGDAGLGDATGYAHDNQKLYLQGSLVDTVTTGKNQVTATTYSSVVVSDGTFTLRLLDQGGDSDPFCVITGLFIFPTPFVPLHTPNAATVSVSGVAPNAQTVTKSPRIGTVPVTGIRPVGRTSLQAVNFATVNVVASRVLSTLDFYISPTGSDTNDGFTAPWLTLTHAQIAIRSYLAGMTKDINVWIHGGTYYLSSPLTFTNADSGQNGFTVNWRAYTGEYPVISGGVVLTGWTLHNAGLNIWKASSTYKPRMLFVNGVRARRAKSGGGISGSQNGNVGYTTSEFASYAVPSDVEFVYRNLWVEQRLQIQSVAGSAVTMLQPGFNNAIFTNVLFSSLPQWWENAYELLGTPGQCYSDGTYTYYVPKTGEDINSATIVAPILDEVLHVNGANYLKFIGLKFCHTTWTLPSVGFGEIQANTYMDTAGFNTSPNRGWLKIPGSIRILNASSHITFSDNVVCQIGTAGIAIEGGATYCTISGNKIYDISGCGITISNTTEINPTTPTAHIDINNNYIHHVGREFSGATGIICWYANNVEIRNNVISYVNYSGISCGWGWGQSGTWPNCTGSNSIHNNLIHHVMQILNDGAGIYCNGVQGGSGQTNSLNVYGNVVHDTLNPLGGGLYIDDGGENVTLTGNGVYNVSPMNDILVHNDYGNCVVTGNYLISGDIRIVPDTLSNVHGADNISGNFTGATPGSITAAAGLETAYQSLLTDTVSGNVGVTTISGSTASKIYHYIFICSSGVYNLTGIATSSGVGHKMTISTGSYTYTGISDRLLYGYKVISNTGTYTYTGKNTGLYEGHKIIGLTGTYNLTGSIVNLKHGSLIGTNTGIYAFTGISANIKPTRKLVFVAGAYSYTGNTAILNYAVSNKIVANTGIYSISGKAANLLDGHKLSSGTGTYTFSGQPIVFGSGPRMVTLTGSYGYTGAPVNFARTRVLQVSAGVYNIVGKNVLFVHTQVSIANAFIYFNLYYT